MDERTERMLTIDELFQMAKDAFEASDKTQAELARLLGKSQGLISQALRADENRSRYIVTYENIITLLRGWEVKGPYWRVRFSTHRSDEGDDPITDPGQG